MKTTVMKAKHEAHRLRAGSTPSPGISYCGLVQTKRENIRLPPALIRDSHWQCLFVPPILRALIQIVIPIAITLMCQI